MSHYDYNVAFSYYRNAECLNGGISKSEIGVLKINRQVSNDNNNYTHECDVY